MNLSRIFRFWFERLYERPAIIQKLVLILRFYCAAVCGNGLVNVHLISLHIISRQQNMLATLFAPAYFTRLPFVNGITTASLMLMLFVLIYLMLFAQ